MKLLWQAWYKDEEIEVAFPPSWEVERVQMADAPPATLEALAEKMQQPIGAPRLKELAAGKQKAVVVVEDITRPSALEPILLLMVKEIIAGGVTPENITFIVGLGAHTPMRLHELEMKLGREIVRNYRLYQNHAHENQAYLGETTRGTPIYINRFFLEADFRVSAGTIVPHGLAGFAGGVKTVAVGMAGIKTLHANHQLAYKLDHSMAGRITGNELRADLEEIGRLVNHHFAVNTIVNSRRELVGLFAGDPIEAHRAGVRFAHSVYKTHIPRRTDIAFFNAYPKDTDLIQLVNSMNAVARDFRRVLNQDGTPVLMTACTHGAGIHYLTSAGMPAHSKMAREKFHLGRHGIIIYSPNLSYSDIHHYPDDTHLYNEWADVISELKRRHGDRASATVFPNGALQIPDDIPPE
jgi:nickel-dependent lactate racemase